MVKQDLVYLYDGSFLGFLSCVFRAYEKKEYPTEIRTDDATLLPFVVVETDDGRADRVGKWLKKTFGGEFSDIITLAYLSGEEGAMADSLRIIRLAEQEGQAVLRDLCNPLVYKMVKLAKSVRREAHRIIEFIRFSDDNGNLVAVINPKHFILPLISSHFERRFPNENFFIYDEVHCAALLHTDSKSDIFPIETFVMNAPSEEEEKFRKLWKLFYDTIAIKERNNPRLRVQHLPKRFWKNVTELADI